MRWKGEKVLILTSCTTHNCIIVQIINLLKSKTSSLYTSSIVVRIFFSITKCIKVVHQDFPKCLRLTINIWCWVSIIWRLNDVSLQRWLPSCNFYPQILMQDSFGDLRRCLNPSNVKYWEKKPQLVPKQPHHWNWTCYNIIKYSFTALFSSGTLFLLPRIARTVVGSTTALPSALWSFIQPHNVFGRLSVHW